jgi:hypothetical protein
MPILSYGSKLYVIRTDKGRWISSAIGFMRGG